MSCTSISGRETVKMSMAIVSNKFMETIVARSSQIIKHSSLCGLKLGVKIFFLFDGISPLFENVVFLLTNRPSLSINIVNKSSSWNAPVDLFFDAFHSSVNSPVSPTQIVSKEKVWLFIVKKSCGIKVSKWWNIISVVNYLTVWTSWR